MDWPLGTAALFAVDQILTRNLAAIDDPRTTILHTSLAAALVTSALLPTAWSWPTAGGWGAAAAAKGGHCQGD